MDTFESYLDLLIGICEQAETYNDGTIGAAWLRTSCEHELKLIEKRKSDIDMLEALKRAEQSIRNISLNLPDGDLKTIAHNEADNLGNAISNAQAWSRTLA